MQSFREFSDTIRELTDEEIMNVAGGTVPPSCTPQAMRNSAMVGAISFALPAAFFGGFPAIGGAVFGASIGGLSQLMTCRADLK
ncbi:hypothetical protein [Methylobacterium radiotolerans]|uniref:hypothetical protein n=1 Tax=Methylobacterium radiotolerans TaxID=31998 RepID=UPI001197B202|nr:hypothetical protein [Methylobacterium radiotolerans]GEN01272.1 hypothetical protein MRA01_58110 [Methylobacterium radiotolerans]